MPNRQIRNLLAIVPLAMLAPAVHAQGWTGKAELGLLFADGNTESKSANSRIDFTHEGVDWKHNVFASALYGENAEFANAERYEARYKADYRITDKLSWFVALRGEQDRFSGFAWQGTASSGATYTFIDDPDTHFDASIGAGYKRFQEQILVQLDSGEVIDRIRGGEGDDPVATLASNYEHALSGTTKITNQFLTEAGRENTSVQNDLALQVAMFESFALAIGIGVRYNSDPPPDAESTDTLFTVNLVYNLE